ncbi:conserved hypothetical protein [Leishmania infantum JPCM5]|uniref:Uncharacterized protein n=2 Tax=Leishmania infantum TaxID=5671 RepID=A4HRF9_LEIIN|nr:conserved hypothetical protein [Leishmania infantum JPCM5]CAC9436625.1 hypothetical_protein_-_conserved [Leishmania infantum]CAM65189.1 conserved hypothetical protein [Leishmania infantum JPCM5]SUZ38576.1 hypothetical_protein_-_conserved [Leishmania infantum]|eukprot:XP_001462651.1 conserved hypothetical protein [Leishmania infantum JPCM5]
MAPPIGRIATDVVVRSSKRVPSLAAPRSHPLATTIICASLRSTVTAAAVAEPVTVASPASALVCSSRTFYDKIREKRDGSEDEGPDQMFQDFPKGPNRQRVPAELHRSNQAAVEDAEKLSRAFCVFLLLLFVGLLSVLNPFQSDPYGRPDGYGMTEPRLVYGSSDLACRSSGSGRRREEEDMRSIRRLA